MLKFENRLFTQQINLHPNITLDIHKSICYNEGTAPEGIFL